MTDVTRPPSPLRRWGPALPLLIFAVLGGLFWYALHAGDLVSVKFIPARNGSQRTNDSDDDRQSWNMRHIKATACRPCLPCGCASKIRAQLARSFQKQVTVKPPEGI